MLLVRSFAIFVAVNLKVNLLQNNADWFSGSNSAPTDDCRWCSSWIIISRHCKLDMRSMESSIDRLLHLDEADVVADLIRVVSFMWNYQLSFNNSSSIVTVGDDRCRVLDGKIFSRCISRSRLFQIICKWHQI